MDRCTNLLTFSRSARIATANSSLILFYAASAPGFLQVKLAQWQYHCYGHLGPVHQAQTFDVVLLKDATRIRSNVVNAAARLIHKLRVRLSLT